MITVDFLSSLLLFVIVVHSQHALSSQLDARAGEGDSVVLRGLSIAGKRENSNAKVKPNGPKT